MNLFLITVKPLITNFSERKLQKLTSYLKGIVCEGFSSIYFSAKYIAYSSLFTDFPNYKRIISGIILFNYQNNETYFLFLKASGITKS